MKFFEKYLEREINFAEEIDNIWQLCKRHDEYGKSIYDEMNRYFLDWNLRNRCVKLTNYLSISGMEKTIQKAKDKETISLDEFFEFIEIVYSWMYFLVIKDEILGTHQYLLDNINKTLDKLNFEIVFIDLEQLRYPICIEKDYKVFEASEIVNDDKLSEKIYLYNYRQNKGNLYEKAIILSRLYMYF